jgi:hypothetical protein
MPLNSAALAQALLDLGDPETSAAAGQAWANAMGEYAAEVVPPSTSAAAATSTLAGAAPLMEVAFLAFGATLGLGMAPAFLAVPPAAPVGFAAFLAVSRDSREAAMQELAGLIDTWMRTGTANTVPPTTPVPWS